MIGNRQRNTAPCFQSCVCSLKIYFCPCSSNPKISTEMSGRGKGGKGLGKGGAKRHRKVLRDQIHGITKPANSLWIWWIRNKGSQRCFSTPLYTRSPSGTFRFGSNDISKKIIRLMRHKKSFRMIKIIHIRVISGKRVAGVACHPRDILAICYKWFIPSAGTRRSSMYSIVARIFFNKSYACENMQSTQVARYHRAAISKCSF